MMEALMNESERLQRYRDEYDKFYANEKDEVFADRIAALLNHPEIDKHCLVDAYYYDFSVIPRDIQEKLQIWRDAYFIFGITNKGEIVSKWVDRWDLDCDNDIVDGNVVSCDLKPIPIPIIEQKFDANLLSYPMPNILNLWKGDKS
jgi:hypothetical protein